MAIITLRVNEQDEKLIKEYARLNNMSISELFRSSILAKIKNDINLTFYHQAIAEHRNNPNDVSFYEMITEFRLTSIRYQVRFETRAQKALRAIFGKLAY